MATPQHEPVSEHTNQESRLLHEYEEHQISPLQDVVFSQPLNSQSKRRRRRPSVLAGMERNESSRNPNNLYQDTSDSELDEIESEQELEREYLEYVERQQQPKLQALQDGDICYYCGSIAPFSMRHTTPYIDLYQCALCRQNQKQLLGSLPPETLQEHKEELQELVENVGLGSNSWFAITPPPANLQNNLQTAGSTHASIPEGGKDPQARRALPHSQEVQATEYRPESRPLIAGGMTWTVQESDLFFHGLRRFGKHNVWAIQEHIKSRSLAEVTAMIQTMEMELARHTQFGFRPNRLSEMPMAEEADEKQIEVEELCAAVLTDIEMRDTWRRYKEAPVKTRSEALNKTGLFNLRTLTDLSTRLYIQNEEASIDRDTVAILYDALKEWLTSIIKELIMLHHERHRIRLLLDRKKPSDIVGITEEDVVRILYAQQKALGPGHFFATLSDRLRYLVIDDSSSAIELETAGLKTLSPLWIVRGLGRKYYLNEQVDRARAEAPDSDQDMETDDGVSAEEEAEVLLEAPLPVVAETPGHESRPTDARERKARRDLKDIYPQQAAALGQWDNFWSIKAREARQETQEMTLFDRSTAAPRRKRFRAEYPLTPSSMTFNDWREGAGRLEANSFALPINVENDAGVIAKDLLKRNQAVSSMNKSKRSHEQLLYLDPPKQIFYAVPGRTKTREKMRFERFNKMKRDFDEKAQHAPRIRFIDMYAPGYGILPRGESFMYDPTRPPPKNGYGLGERDRGGLWLMDRNAKDQSTGYITVSDTEDEEEETRGWERQMKADDRIEQRSKLS
ncbi:hypothetical protein BGZ54_005251 [Gamsiella multidivaricata]|nr:hypothetical protein BGZ54_005251 [Gamsiella multidivaricata]